MLDSHILHCGKHNNKIEERFCHLRYANQIHYQLHLYRRLFCHNMDILPILY